MRQYLDALRTILDSGIDRPNRTGVPSRAVVAVPLRFKMAEGFPAVTTKQLYWKKVAAELLFFLKGSQDIHELQGLGGDGLWEGDAFSPKWAPKANFPGDMGRVYGVQWRRWRKFTEPVFDSDGELTKQSETKSIDQIANLIQTIRENPNDRRMIVSAWNPGELDQMCLPPCHAFFQCFMFNDRLTLVMYQRSCDMFLGEPFNIASYAMLLHMLAQVTDTIPDELVIILGDAHIYHNHFEAVAELLKREPLPLPKLWLNPEVKDIDNFKMEDIKLMNYKHHPPIKAKLNT